MKKLFFIIALTFLLFSCKDKEVYYRFSDEERKLFPSFKIGDTLTYKRQGDVKLEKYVLQQIENGFNIQDAQGAWVKYYKEFYKIRFFLLEGINSNKNDYHIEFLKSDNYFQFTIYWDTGFEIKSPFLDTLVVDTNYQDLCDSINIKPSNGTFKKLFYLKQKGIVSFVDCEEETWKLED